MRQLMVSLLMLMVLSAMAAEKTASEFHASDPVLITSAGQSSDVLMVKLLAERAGIAYQFDKMAQPDMLKEVKTLILVAGGSSKGLGAARIDKEQELNRVKQLVARAEQDRIPIVAIHVGGKARRGKLSDYFSDYVARHANLLIVVKEGDYDGFFSRIAQEKKIPIHLPDELQDVQQELKQVFQK